MKAYLDARKSQLANAIEQAKASLNALLGAQEENRLASVECARLDADVEAQKQVEGIDGSE